MGGRKHLWKWVGSVLPSWAGAQLGEEQQSSGPDLVSLFRAWHWAAPGAEMFLSHLVSTSRTELTSTSGNLRGRSGLLRGSSAFCALVLYLVKGERAARGREVPG